MEFAVSVKQLCFSYENAPEPAVQDVSFELDSGSYTVIAGVNGSGKSTTARIIAGLLQPSAGTVEIADGLRTGFVFQSPKDQLICGVVARDTAFGPQCQSLPDSEIELRTIESLKSTGILDYAMHKSMFLSLGQTQKAALSGILAINPDILILDESVSMLDPKSREEIFTFLDMLHKKKRTILHITHDSDAISRAKDIIVMNGGKIIWKGNSSSFFADKTGSVYRSVFGTPLENRSCFQKKTQKSPSTEILLKAENISFSYGTHAVLKNISFSLKRGTLTALTGASGSGKTTLLEILAGLKKHDSGTVRSAGKPLLCQQNSDAALFEVFAADDVAFGPRNSGIKGKELLECVKTAMNRVNLPFEEFASKQTNCLSGGQKRRLSVAGIIAMKGDILLFDEPSAGLDGAAKYTVMHLLRSLAESGKTVLFTTHHYDEAQFADTSITLEKAGLIAPDFSPEEENKADGQKTVLTEQKPSAGIFSPEYFSRLLDSLSENHAEQKKLQKLPAVIKYILFIALFAFSVAVQPVSLCAALLPVTILYALCSCCPAKKLFRSLIKILPFLLFFCILQMIFAPASANDTVFLPYKYFFVTAGKLWQCLKIILHTECALCCICAFSSSATENDILKGFSDLLAPLRLLKIPVKYPVILMEIIFRFIPLLLDEAISIIKIQLVRGGLKDEKGFFGKIRAIIPLIVPLIIQTVRRAEILADAMTVRGFK
ncbi:MAG: ATP-binding cassette domain-containing protein [Treponema porcinum]|uniref:ATP-binding cassette domain-containing protein n=4 Tax=Treponema porcinum TaxID=261392 RepID=UPI0023538C2D|nr:ATP-binding cassette domain-containing protein [Treponema porcinum]MCI6816475.1 ATP-binding cassette domain-containing protein [Treponema porcinum]MCI6983991.1 ATP-binding cassette domain-containing protein [Treponema porcinum]MDY5048390.1 ATP-binding cassette domain-containing protein [Treponema porcinum]